MTPHPPTHPPHKNKLENVKTYKFNCDFTNNFPIFYPNEPLTPHSHADIYKAAKLMQMYIGSVDP